MAKFAQNNDRLFMKKYIIDFNVDENIILSEDYSLLKLSPLNNLLPAILPGQFVQVEVENSKDTYLRRPISVNFVDYDKNQLWLLIRKAGKGTSQLIKSEINSKINIILPLGNGFTFPKNKKEEILLVGGGVGVAPLLFFGSELKKGGWKPSFLLGAKTEFGLLLLDQFKEIGDVYISTDDGSLGEKGYVGGNSILQCGRFKHISCCGPLPMMKSVAQSAKNTNSDCEVSLENVMACGIGACLCCVEDTKESGNVCVCKDGPIFNINQLKW